MSKFSDRYGYTSESLPFQRERVDESLRTALWNVLKISFWDQYSPYDTYGHGAHMAERIDLLIKRLWFYYFNNDMDSLPPFAEQYSATSYDYLKNYFMTCEWYGVFNLLESIAADDTSLLGKDERAWVNRTLETHNSAYRFVDEQIVEITSAEEIVAVESALASTQGPARDHIDAALKMLSDKEDRDYRNSVKESISAVEATVREITGSSSITLGAGLKEIVNCHPALLQGFQKIYGYTSDESGIRHSLTDQAETTHAEAKFMLVACSAIISYLIDSNKNA